MRYNIIYADPPWSYEDKALAGNRGAICKYPVMGIDELKSLPIKNIAADDAILFMWATLPKLPEALELTQSWGFKYKTTGFVWVKTNPKSGTPFFGMGRWTRANSEVVLLGTKGRPQRVSAGVSQIVQVEEEILESSILKPHSRKPDEVRKKIVQLCGEVPRIELFARESTPGWDVFGNEVQGSITLE